MKFAYADPPYLGCGKSHYGKHHEAAADWDDVNTHRLLVERLLDEYKDGWFLSLHEPSLKVILNMCPDGVRVAAWVKPFASFKPGVTRAYTWEPVIFHGGRSRTKNQDTWRDHIVCNITLRKGLPGAKPWAFCEWVLDGLNYQRGDIVDDLFPGTGIMGEVLKAREDQPFQRGLFA